MLETLIKLNKITTNKYPAMMKYSPCRTSPSQIVVGRIILFLNLDPEKYLIKFNRNIGGEKNCSNQKSFKLVMIRHKKK